MSYNNKVDVITPVLDYDINGNHATLTLSPAAMTYHSSSIKVTKDWKNYDGTGLTAPVSEVEVELYRDGTFVEKKKVTAANHWEVSFDNIDIVNPATGANYQYTVTNKKSLNVTPLVPSTITKTITKEWANLTQAEIDTLSTTIALYKNGNKVQEVTVDKNNHFTATFSNLPVTDTITSTANVYTVKEIDSDGNAVEEGNTITIDSRNFTVHYDGTKIVNTYVPKPVLVDPPVKKIVEGNPTNASTFQFEMKAINPIDPMPNGSVNGVKLATVIGSGEVEFGTFEITQAGTYQYVIREINGGIANYTYDTTLYTITFDVRDIAGQLVADTHVEKADGTVVNEAVFTNVYKAPVSTPKTGDSSHLPIYIGAIIIALVGFGFAFIKRIRSNKQS